MTPTFWPPPGFPMLERRIGRDACAEQRRGRRGIEVVRDAQDKSLIDGDFVGVAAKRPFVRRAAYFIFIIVGAGEAVLAILLQPVVARGAMPAAVDKAADPDQIANLVFAGAVPDGGHASDDFVSGNKRILRPAPFVSGRVNVGMADSAIKDVDHDIAWAWIAALEGKRNEFARRRMVGVAVDGNSHFVLL